MTTIDRHSPEFRRTHLGASQIAAAIGIDPYLRPIELWEMYVGLRAWPETSPAMEWGHRLEDVIASYAAEKLGVAIVTANTVMHPRIDWLVATPDRRIIDQPRNIQAKSVGAVSAAIEAKRRWGDDGSDEAPMHVLVQVQTEMLVDRAVGYSTEETLVAAWLAGREPLLLPVAYDEKVAQSIVTRGAVFWKHVTSGVPPPPDDSDAYHEYLYRAMPVAKKDAVMHVKEGDLGYALADQFIRANAARKEAERGERYARNSLEAHMMGFEVVHGDFGKVRWGNALNPAKLDKEAYADELASMIPGGRHTLTALAAKHTRQEGTHRVMTAWPRKK